MNKISIIIPILNEAEIISGLIEHLIINSSKENISEIIIVDGGSNDGSHEIVSKFVTSSDSDSSKLYREADPETSSGLPRHKIKLMASVKGRAKQMNRGSKQATGNILYFLHADSFPPKHFDQLIIDEIKKGNLSGCFKMKFDNNHWWLQIAGWLTQFSWKACRGGDQSQFISKQLFKKLNGFDEAYSIYEDYELINKLYDKKEFVVIQEWLTTSARRYNAKGIWKLQYHFCMIYIKKMFGASAQELHEYYLKNIN